MWKPRAMLIVYRMLPVHAQWVARHDSVRTFGNDALGSPCLSSPCPHRPAGSCQSCFKHVFEPTYRHICSVPMLESSVRMRQQPNVKQALLHHRHAAQSAGRTQLSLKPHLQPLRPAQHFLRRVQQQHLFDARAPAS